MKRAEAFMLNQLQKVQQELILPTKGDFVIKQQYTIEIGGKNKGFEQLIDTQHAFVLADDLEIGFQQKIPLWLFGFLY